MNKASKQLLFRQNLPNEHELMYFTMLAMSF